MTARRTTDAPGASVACTTGALPRPQGHFLLEHVLERNAEYIIPKSWRDLGEAECLRRVREMRVRNLEERKRLLEEAENDPAVQERERQRCAEDLVYFLTRYGWMYNADARQEIPFIPVESQVTEVLYPFYFGQYVPLDPDNPEADKRHHMYEKPRKVGVTWCILAGGSWAMCFHHLWPGRSKNVPHVGGVAADVKEHVKDRENPESHLGRLEQLIRKLPRWLLPGRIRPDDDEGDGGGRARDHKGDTFSENKISFPENKSFIVAKAAKRNVGRSVRFSWFLMDEEEFAERAGAAIRSLMDATSCLYRVSSVEGNVNSFVRDLKNPRLKVNRHFLRYTDVPWYGPAWLKAQQDTRSPEDFRREILCDRNASGGKLYWAPPFDEAVNVVERDLAVVRNSPVWVTIDIGKADGLAIEYLQNDETVEFVNCHGMVYRRDATLEWMIPFLLGALPESNLCGDPFPKPELWNPRDREFVEHVGRLRAQAGRFRFVAGSDAAEQRMHADSFVVQMRRMWGVTVIPVRILDKLEAIDKVKWMVPYIRISRKVNEMTPGQYDDASEPPMRFSDVFYSYRKQVKRDTDEILPSGRPVHDRSSNPADGLQYAVDQMPRVMKRTPREVARMNAAREQSERFRQRPRGSAAGALFRSTFGEGSTDA